jgi:hypothetical protein
MMYMALLIASLSLPITLYTMDTKPNINIHIRNDKIAALLHEKSRVTIVILDLKTDDCSVTCLPFKEGKLQRNQPIPALDITIRDLEIAIYKTIQSIKQYKLESNN